MSIPVHNKECLTQKIAGGECTCHQIYRQRLRSSGRRLCEGPECGEPIAAKILRADPTATRCGICRFLP